MSYLIYPPVLAAANVVVPQVTTYTGSQAPPPSPILIPTNAITYTGNTPAPPPPAPPPVPAPSPVVCYPAQMVPAAMQTVTTTTGYFPAPAGVMTYCGLPPPPPTPPGLAVPMPMPVQQPFVGVAVGMPWVGGSVPLRLAP